MDTQRAVKVQGRPGPERAGSDLVGHLLGPDHGRQPGLHAHAGLDGELQGRDLAHARHDVSRFCGKHLLPRLPPPRHLDHVQSRSSYLGHQGTSAIPAGPPETVLHALVPQQADLDSLRHSLRPQLHRRFAHHCPGPRQRGR